MIALMHDNKPWFNQYNSLSEMKKSSRMQRIDMIPALLMREKQSFAVDVFFQAGKQTMVK